MKKKDHYFFFAVLGERRNKAVSADSSPDQIGVEMTVFQSLVRVF